MKHEGWLHYQRQSSKKSWNDSTQNPKTRAETIAELRAEVDSPTSRIKAERLAELRVEVKRLISIEVTHASQQH